MIRCFSDPNKIIRPTNACTCDKYSARVDTAYVLDFKGCIWVLVFDGRIYYLSSGVVDF